MNVKLGFVKDEFPIHAWFAIGMILHLLLRWRSAGFRMTKQAVLLKEAFVMPSKRICSTRDARLKNQTPNIVILSITER